MNKLLLIHGAWHGSWCWHKLIPLLEGLGYQILAPNLPRHDQPGKLVKFPTFKEYVESVIQLIEFQPEPVVLLGHSMAGAIISQVAEYLPGQISRLIYLSAYLLNDGESILRITMADADGQIYPNLIYGNNKKTASINPDNLKMVFYNDCSVGDYDFARPLLVEQSLEPLGTPVRVTSENWGSVERHYIKCKFDNTVSISCQEKMLETNPCKTVVTMETGHSPFLSAPVPLANLIHDICYLN